MSPKILGVLAIVAAGAGVALSAGEAVDVDAVATAEDGSKSVVTVRCKAGAKAEEMDCGDLPANVEPVALTASAPYVTLSAAGTKEAREQPCACGPVDGKRVCTVLDAEGERPARPGEHLAAGTWQGACAPKPCFEHAAVIAQRGLGYAQPVACGGRAAKEAAEIGGAP